MDKAGEEVPTGVIGRLLIGGDYLFNGYLNRPELTSKALARSDAARGRLYDTGDLVRLRRDGELLFCGREDFQVKIRGQRLELGEIEAVLSEHPAVQQAVVMKQEDAQTHQAVLVAYAVLREPPRPRSGATKILRLLRCLFCTTFCPLPVIHHQLLSLCKDRLAAYMIPSFWLFLSSLPMTGTGKVDRKRLPWSLSNSKDNTVVFASSSFSTDSASVVSPRSQLERQLRAIFAEVLGLNESTVCVERSFFADYGGNSLMAARLAGLVSARLRTKPLSVAEVLRRQVGFSFSWLFLSYFRALHIFFFCTVRFLDRIFNF